MLGQFTYQRGLSNLITLNGGVTASDGYSTLELGSVFNTQFGAMGFDITNSHTRLNDTTLTGQSYRLSFSRLIKETGTNVTLAAYRYSTSGFMDLQTALNIRDTLANPNNGQLLLNDFARLRSRAEVNINQNFNNNTSAYISGSIQDYWGGQPRNTQFQAGLRQGFKWGSLGLDASRQTNLGNKTVNSIMFSINYNLDSSKIFSSSLRHDSTGSNDAQINMSGTIDEDRKLSYGINAGESHTGGSNSSNYSSIAGNIAYQGSKGIVNASASSATHSKQASFGLSGSVVAAAGTVLLGQQLGESAAIIEAPDAKGAMVMPGIGVEVDGSGHALLPSLSSYRKNDIQLETGSMSDGVQLDYSSTQAIPRSGSVILVKFKTSKGLPLLLKTRFADESPLPFGASVKDKDGNVVGDIGQGGKLFARVKQASGNLFVDLEGGKKCMLRYDNADSSIASFKSSVCQTSLN
ncbi:fimbria/pilus outer membrane usher protein [Aquitalea denitrificans]|uniref:fimbria/pilus outer membrane usher protein n=1 Tax=Aquitalea denitrificans TaxID=519081 RepID=UPI001358135D|nr:fimbria/pilus outer membrane usher protein [Aquitalea denitrificans]